MLPRPSEDFISSRSRLIPARARRSLIASGVALGAVAGIALTTGVALDVPRSLPVAASLAVAYPAHPVSTAASVVGAVPALEQISVTASEADATLRAAESTLGQARQLRSVIRASGVELGAGGKIDTTSLHGATERLAAADVIPVLLFPELTEQAATHTRVVADRMAEVREGFNAAVAAKAAANAAAAAQREAEAAAAAEAQRQAEALAARNTPEGAQAYAAQLSAEKYGWGGEQFSCLSRLWERESNWNYQARNASSGATGIPQALPGEKMATFGADWATNAGTQIAWGLDYISRAYGSPCAAWGHSQATNWY